MNENVYWVLELALQPARRDEFAGLAAEMVDAARAEPGMLNYEWNVNAERTVCHVYVRYRDPAAVVAHLRVFGTRYSARFLTLAKITRLTVYGNADDAVRQVLAPYGATYLAPMAGFAR